MSRLHLLLIALLLIGLGVTGCSEEPADNTPTPEPTLEPATSVPTPTAASNGTPTPGSGILPPGPITLTVWTTEEFAPADDDPGGRLLLSQLLVFDREQPELTVEVITKRPAGPGGMMDYLRTAPDVAPDVLPDVMVLSSQMLQEAVSGGLLLSLEGLLDSTVIDELFPVAQQLGMYENSLMGIPFRLDFEHLVYNTAVLTETAPTTWDAVLESGGPYVFAAANEASMDAPLNHYLSAGGSLYNESGTPHLDRDPLVEVFVFYQRARTDRVIPASVLNTASVADSWGTYRAGGALLAHTSTDLYLTQRAELLNTRVAPIPGPEEGAPPMVSGWHWAILTQDPTRQQLAAELLSWLMAADNLGVWSYSSNWLPATQGALAVWPTDDPYVQFAHQQLSAAVPRPDEAYYQVVQPLLSQAVRDIILANSSPAEAAAAIAP